MDSPALGHAELSVSLALWQGVGKPLQNQRPQSGKAPLLWDIPPSPTRARSCRIRYCTLGTLEPFQLWLGLGQAGFLGLTAPRHGRQAGKKLGILACDIDLVSSERVNEIHTSCKTPQVGSISLFLVKTISSESLPLLQNHFFLLL